MVGTCTLVFPEPRTLAMRAFPLADRGPTGRIVVTMADITQRRRLEVHGPNQLAAATRESPLQAFLRQYRDFMQIILLVAAVVAWPALGSAGIAATSAPRWCSRD